MHTLLTVNLDEIHNIIWHTTTLSCGAKFTYTDKHKAICLEKEKNKIEGVDQRAWVNGRKFMNIYEYPRIKPEYNSVKGLTKNPASRAYYKLWEMLHDFNINCNGDSLSLAESPGGFIQAIDDYRLIKRIKNCMCYTISLTSESEIYDIPRFHKNIIRNKNVEIFNFLEGNGDLLQLSTFLNIQKKLKNSKIILVTADGGINDHGEFNNKELNHINLIFCEFINAVFVLENGGTFIVKIFDIFTDAMIHLIHLITYLFGDTKITKPLTSRSTNSEKYVVCSNFKKNKLTINLRNNLVKLMRYIHQEKKIITSLFDIAPGEFLNKIINYNTVTVKNQIINIEKILEYIKSDKKKYNDFSRVKDTLVRNWLVKYKLIQK